MMDNASNMNAVVDKVSDDLEHKFDIFMTLFLTGYAALGHIINLAVMEFLVGKRPLTTELFEGPSEQSSQ